MIDITNGSCSFGTAGDGGKTFDVLFCGDVCPNGRAEPKILAGESAAMLADAAAELSANDLSLVNVEVALTRAETPIAKSGPNLKADPRCVAFFEAGGWDVACCANNHIGDYGPTEVGTTLDLLRARGLHTVGAGADLAAARQPLFIERGGLTVAILAFAENEFGGAQRGVAGANPLQPLRNIGEIHAAAARADLVLVLVHGGNEYLPVPSPRMVETYRAFADAGATAVVANHTHCPQGIELWHGVPIVYSLGNFLFDTRRAYGGYLWWYGSMIRIGFAGGRAARLTVIPHHCAPCGEAVTLLRGAERRRFLAYLQRLCTIVPDEKEVARIFDAWCARWIRSGGLAGLAQPFYPLDWSDPAAVENLMRMRNLHTCEAHAELLTRALRIAEERREEEAAAYLPKLEALLNPEEPCP